MYDGALGVGQSYSNCMLTQEPTKQYTGQTDPVMIADAGYIMSIQPWEQANPSQTACLAGTYNPNTGSTSSSACGDADAGSLCSNYLGTGQSSQTACLAGTYNPNTGSTASTDCVMQMQVTMLIKQVNPAQTACLAGTYNPNTGSTSSSDCLDADADTMFQHRVNPAKLHV